MYKLQVFTFIFGVILLPDLSKLSLYRSRKCIKGLKIVWFDNIWNDFVTIFVNYDTVCRSLRSGKPEYKYGKFSAYTMEKSTKHVPKPP